MDCDRAANVLCRQKVIPMDFTQPLDRLQLRQLPRLAVRSRGKVYVVKLEDLDWLETAGNYVRLHVQGASHLYRDSLLNFEMRLDPRRFVKIHRSTIVNIDRITQLEPTFKREHIVTLCDGTRLTLTAPYRSRLQALVGQF